MNNKHYALGLDIGTTTISAAVMDAETKKVVETCTVPNDSPIQTEYKWEHIQSPDRIFTVSKEILDKLMEKYSVVSIGVTGQMHGLVYTSPEGKALSPLYTWQDERAGLGEPSAVEEILRTTGYAVSAGYGLATHYCLHKEGKTPKETYYVSTIMDHVTMRLVGLPRPVIHATNAASLGLYRIADNSFDSAAMAKLGLDPSVLPEVTAEYRVLGEYKGIPVSVGIGDNQAAFLGSVGDNSDAILVNIGTGSQISVLCGRDVPLMSGSIETRPYSATHNLLSGSCLCGGRAYAILKEFFARFMSFFGSPEADLYSVMNRMAEEGRKKGNVLSVCTSFCGTRDDAGKRGEILGIGEDNFTPEGVAAGVLCGMASELYEMYEKMPIPRAQNLVASGNAVRKNPVLREILSEMFGMPIRIPEHTEEAAVGAALSSLK